MQCPRCHANDQRGHCSDCGAIVELHCDRCGRASPIDVRFCSGCGSQLAAGGHASSEQSDDTALATLVGERRVLTVVISDLSGYTAMGESLDAEDVAHVMSAIRTIGDQTIESFGGIVNQFIGDEIVSVFGLSTASGDTPRRAVAGALHLHDRVTALNDTLASGLDTPLRMHSGIQTGTLVVRPTDDRNGRYELTGDTINTAARLLQLAGRGEIVIGDDTFDVASPFFDCEPIGDHVVRGKSSPITAHRVLRERVERTSFDARRDRGLNPMVGRRRELEQLLAIARDAAEGNVRTAIIEGDAGMGKSRLSHEFTRSLNADFDVRFQTGRCRSYGTVTPFLPFVHVLRGVLGTTRNSTTDEAAAAIRQLMVDEPELVDHAPAYAYLLSAISLDELPRSWRGDALQHELQRSLIQLLRAVGRGGFTVIQLDDWHWADAASAQLLNLLFAELRDLPMLFVLSQRPGIPFDERATTVRLDALALEETTDFIANCFDAEAVETPLARQVHDVTLGNPLFVEEVCNGLRSAGQARVSSGVVVSSVDLRELELPTTVQSVILGRVDALPLPLRETLRVASVIGREFDLEVLGRLVDLPDLERQVNDLIGEDLIESMADSDVERYRFRHVILQTTIYDSLLRRDRRSVHAQIAGLIEERLGDDVRRDHHRHVDALAHHYAAAGERDGAIHYLELAGRRALGEHSLDAAQQQFRLAIDQSWTGEQTDAIRGARLRLALAWSEACIFNPSATQVDVLDRVLIEARNSGQADAAAFLQYWISWIRYSTGQIRDAEVGTRELLSEVTGGRMRELAECHLGQVLVADGRPSEAIEQLEAGTRRRHDELQVGARSRSSVSGMYCYSRAQLGVALADFGRVDAADEVLDDALELALAAGENGTVAAIRICRAGVDCGSERWERSRSELQAISEIPVVSVSRYVQIIRDVLAAYVDVRSAGPEHLPNLRHAVALHVETEAKLSLSRSLSLLADALLAVGLPDEARATAHEVFEVASEIGGAHGTSKAAAVLIRTSGLNGAELDELVVARWRGELDRGCNPGAAIVQAAGAAAHLAVGEIESARACAELAISTGLLPPDWRRHAETIIADA